MIDQPTDSNQPFPRGAASMVAPRAIYFFFYAALAYLISYLTLYYQSLGLSGLEIGLLSAVTPLIGWVAGPFWGAIADITHRHKRILILSFAATIVAVLLLSTARSYGWLILFVAAYAFFNAPIIPLVDNSVVELLGGRRQEYGRQRVWGTYGWGLASLTGGWMLQRFGFPVIFYGFAFLMGFGLLAAARFPVSEAPIAMKFSRNILQLLTNRRWLLFLALVMVLGAGMAMIGNYFSIYLTNLGAPIFWIGVAYTLATISEIPALFYSNLLIRRFGLVGLLVIGGSAFGLRALAFSFATEPWQPLALQLAHGLTFALVLVAGVEYASQIAPPGLGATAQGLFSGVFNGLGYAIGGLVGGILLDKVGVQGMYRVAGVSALLAVGLFLLVHLYQRRAEGAVNSELRN